MSVVDYTWVVYAVVAGAGVMIALDKKTPWWGRGLAMLFAVGFGYNAFVALMTPDAWLSWVAISLAVYVTFWVRRRQNQQGSSDDEDDE